MGWLDEILGETLKNLRPGMFTDWSFGFADMQRAITIVEAAIARNEVETADAGRAAALKAAADPSHSFIKDPVFVPMGRELRNASLTLPRILRSGLFIEIYSQTEFLLLAWCESISDDRASLSKRLKGETTRSRPSVATCDTCVTTWGSPSATSRTGRSGRLLTV